MKLSIMRIYPKGIMILASALLITACQEKPEDRATRELNEIIEMAKREEYMTLEDRAAHEAKKITERICPQDIGNGMTYDSITFNRNKKEIHYHYTISGAGDSLELIKSKEQEMREQMLEAMRNDLSKKAYKEAGFSFGATIYSKKNPRQKLFSATFAAKDLSR